MESERPAPIKLYGIKKQVKFNIIQKAIRCIVGGHKTPFLFEGATCQRIDTKKRMAAEENKGTL
jgi:hypothetical protein